MDKERPNPDHWAVVDPWGRRVIIDRDYWERHVLTHHEDMAELLSPTMKAIQEPELVSIPDRFPDRRNYYRRLTERLFIMASVDFTWNEGFLVTAYLNSGLRKREVIEWTAI